RRPVAPAPAHRAPSGEPRPDRGRRPYAEPVLVERDGLVDRLRGERGRVVAVLGEAGAGKTALVQTALADAAWGWCEPLVTARPLRPVPDSAPALWPG